VSSVTGGGDCRRLLLALFLLASLSALSAVPGGVGSDAVGLGVNDAVLIDGVRRWRVRYDVDRGSSGRAEWGGVATGWAT
jgi:hypothetical protein